MIDVPQLDLYLKGLFYIFNFKSELYSSVPFSDGVKSWVQFFLNNQGIFKRFKNTIEKPEFGFEYELWHSRTMFGIREITVKDPQLLLPAPYLKIYSRLLYNNGFLEYPDNFDTYKYFFRYYPKMIVNLFNKNQETGEIYTEPSTHWIVGTHGIRHGINKISYNVAVEVGLDTIIEEELHAQSTQVHGTQSVSEILQQVQEKMPELKIEIESNLNRILSTEERKFKNIGEVLQIENASELRILEIFVEQFEKEVIESTIVSQ